MTQTYQRGNPGWLFLAGLLVPIAVWCFMNAWAAHSARTTQLPPAKCGPAQVQSGPTP